ncbi:MAG TPA: ribokinase [Bradyrhizobium sp.]|nr:ribokinase [Bradyrhizobium sp.]
MGRVVVAGSINMDVVALAERHPRVGETVAGTSVKYFPGGKGANQAVAAAKLSAPTLLIGRLGSDAFGAELKSFLTAQGVDLSSVTETADAHSGTAIITLADADNTIVVIPGANGLVSADDVTGPALSRGDVAVSQFEIPMPAIAAFFAKARTAGARTILNPAPMRAIDRTLLEMVDILVLNETELGLLAKADLHESDEPERFAEAAKALLTRPGQTVCVTLGKRGALALVDGAPVLVPGREVKAVDTTGAGDCFVGALAAQLAQGTLLSEALGFANLAASICVQRMGASPSMPTRAEVTALL